MLLPAVKIFSVCPLALKWYRKKGNIQLEITEMEEEQRSLCSIHTVSVLGLLRDPCVRWQVITIAVVNIGMQLSGIDAVSEKMHSGPILPLYGCVCSFARPPVYTSQFHMQRLGNGAGGSRTMPHYLLVLLVP